MAQNKFLGTIGWIKSNLMISSQASEKGYSNENFYPGALSIPESEPKEKIYPLYLGKTDQLLSEITSIIFPGYDKVIPISGVPDLSKINNWEFGCRITHLQNSGNNPLAFRQSKTSTSSSNALQKVGFYLYSKNRKVTLYVCTESGVLSNAGSNTQTEAEMLYVRYEKGKSYQVLGQNRNILAEVIDNGSKILSTAGTFLSFGPPYYGFNPSTCYFKSW